MAAEKQKHVSELVQKSTLLQPEVQKLTLERIPTLTDDLLDQLEAMLSEEPSVKRDIIADAIQSAAQSGDDTKMQRIDASLTKARRNIQRAEEAADTSDESDQIADLEAQFDT